MTVKAEVARFIDRLMGLVNDPDLWTWTTSCPKIPAIRW